MSQIYYDNNGTTKQCAVSVAEQVKWLNTVGNASGISKEAEAGANLINEFKLAVCKHIKSDNYEILITSGGSESNSCILYMCALAYFSKTGQRPMIVTSKIEHSSILECVATMESHGLADVIYISPQDGKVPPESVKRALTEYENIAIVSIMGANNETGIINDIRAISEVCAEADVPLHSDLVQCFGKERCILTDAFSVSFHKFNGPLGLGILGIHKDLVEGYGLQAIIAGKQQNGLRGGTENLPAIAGGLVALKSCMQTRLAKNATMRRIRCEILAALSSEFKVVFMGETKSFANPPIKYKDIIVYVFAPGKSYKDKEYTRCMLPNTLLISIVHKNMCNIELRKQLNNAGVTIGIGSTCNSHSKERSHVISEFAIDKYIAQGVIRISIGDYNTLAEVPKFIKSLKACIKRVIKV